MNCLPCRPVINCSGCQDFKNVDLILAFTALKVFFVHYFCIGIVVILISHKERLKSILVESVKKI